MVKHLRNDVALGVNASESAMAKRLEATKTVSDAGSSRNSMAKRRNSTKKSECAGKRRRTGGRRPCQKWLAPYQNVVSNVVRTDSAQGLQYGALFCHSNLKVAVVIALWYCVYA